MTGYGKSILNLPTKKITIELKSLNSKNLDLNTRIPGVYREKEVEIRRKLAKEIVRGKIDVSFFVETTSEESTTIINKSIVAHYLRQLNEIDAKAETLSIAMRLPDVLKTEREELDETEWHVIETAMDEAIFEFQKFRSDEGEVLRNDFIFRIEEIRKNLLEVIALDEERLDAVREKLLKAITDLKVTVDENRFEQEMIYYLEKLDITEEKVRLNNHLDYFIEELLSKEIIEFSSSLDHLLTSIGVNLAILFILSRLLSLSEGFSNL